jgi:hypothetical protein
MQGYKSQRPDTARILLFEHDTATEQVTTPELDNPTEQKAEPERPPNSTGQHT